MTDNPYTIERYNDDPNGWGYERWNVCLGNEIVAEFYPYSLSDAYRKAKDCADRLNAEYVKENNDGK